MNIMLTKITSAAALANVLRDIRKRKKRTQKEISEELGLMQATVSSFETSPLSTKLETLFKMLAALDLQLYVADRNTDLEIIKADKVWDQEW